jgi:hypothetical protein
MGRGNVLFSVVLIGLTPPSLYQSQNIRHSYISLSLSSLRVANRFLLNKLTGEGVCSNDQLRRCYSEIFCYCTVLVFGGYGNT